MTIYLVGAKKADQGLIGICVIALTADLMIGTTWGATLGDIYERFTTSISEQMSQALLEVQVRDFRRDLGLPDVAPSATAKKDPGEELGK